MLTITFDNGWINKVEQLVAKTLLSNIKVGLLSNGQVVGYAKIDQKGLTPEGFYIKATYINAKNKELVYDSIAIYDKDGAVVGTVSPNVTSIPPYKQVDIELLIELM